MTGRHSPEAARLTEVPDTEVHHVVDHLMTTVRLLKVDGVLVIDAALEVMMVVTIQATATTRVMTVHLMTDATTVPLHVVTTAEVLTRQTAVQPGHALSLIHI